MADLNIPGPKIVGYEGVFGVIATLLIVAPIARLVPGVEGEGFHEDFLDTIAVSQSVHGNGGPGWLFASL